MDDTKRYPMVEKIRQSPPIDITKPYNPDWVKGKTILITGGASGFGAAFARKWASHGATVIIGDINDKLGAQVAREIRKETGSTNVDFVHCDVTDWSSQVNFFREAVKLSPHGGIDVVVPNAGIAGREPLTQPKKMDASEPPKPDFSLIDVNLIGVLYSVHLAFHYLPKNPGSQPSDPNSDPAASPRDRHILLIASIAGLGPLPSSPLYAASKHAVMGLFRTLRGQAFTEGVRVNALCPYFIDTPIIPPGGKLMLAGGALGSVADVVEAGTRLVADPRILGRSLVIGPKCEVGTDDSGHHVLQVPAVGKAESGVWEAYAEDYEDSEVFIRRFVGVLNAVTERRGWRGWAKDVVRVVSVAAFAGVARVVYLRSR